MLQITPPEPPNPQLADGRQIRVESHRGVIDSSAMTKEAFAPELEDEYRLAPSSIPEPPLSSSTLGSSTLGSSTKLVAPPQVSHDPLFEEALSAPPLPVQKPPSQSNAATDSNRIQLLAVQRTARRRQVLMVAVFGSSGVLLAGMLFVGFLYWYTRKPSSSVAAKPTVGNSNTPEQKHVGPKREAEQGLIDNQFPDDVDSTDKPQTPAELVPPSDTAAESEAQSNATEGKSISDAVANAIANRDTEPINPTDRSDNTANGSIFDSVPKTSEQADTPNSATNAAPSSEATASSNSAQGNASATELPDQLKKFQSILDTVIEPQFLEDQAIQKAPPTAKELGLSSGHDAKALPAVDVGKQMALPITGLIIPPGSVSNTISQWVQVSGIPTVVDLDSMAAAGVDPYRSIGKILVSGESPMSQVGESIAKEIGVELKTIENQFLAFHASEKTVREHLPTSIKIDDLVDGDEQAWLVKTLNQIWPEYEGKWIVRDNELTVDADVVDTLAWFWAVRMLETWRFAAGIETQLDKTKLDPSKFVTKFVEPDQLSGLNKPLSLTLVNRAPVAQLISDLCAASKIHGWVDWASVSQKGLAPNTIDFIVSQGRTLRQCLRDLAEKYSLIIACEDDKSIVITTAEVYRAQPRLYVFPSQGKTAEQWIDELQPLTPATAAAAQPVQAYLTPGGEYVIVRCCRPQIRN